MYLEEIYILVCRNIMLILFLHALFIVYSEFCAECAQHACVLYFGVHRQNYAFSEIENWMHLIASKDLCILVKLIVMVLSHEPPLIVCLVFCVKRM